MKLYKGLFYSIAASALLTGCANEAPFVEPSTAGQTGSLKTSCLAPKLTNTEGVVIGTRADVPVVGDFNVVISRNTNARSNSTQGSVEYKYSDMPEVLTLPVGDYKVFAHYGPDSISSLWNKPYAWDEPYYYGESTFAIDANKITDNVEPIVAKLANIRVTIVFHPSLLSAMGDDSMVEVKVGDQGELTFTPKETRSAYFKYVNKSQSLTATFTGTVDGSPVVETEGYDNVAPGNHYRITFKLHGIDDDKPGTVTAGVKVDASVETIPMNSTVDGDGEEYLDDDWRPVQGDNENPTPDVPTPDDPTLDDPTPPSITSAKPTEAGLVPVDLEIVNEVTDDTYCVLNVVSTAEGGIQSFNVDIDSNTLTEDELMGFGLSKTLDLVNPGSLAEPLTGLGLPVNVGGEKDVKFDITNFMGMLSALGEGTHIFTLTVSDANGITTATLKLHTTE